MIRRDFIKTSSQAALLLALSPSLACASNNTYKKNMGIQLWTLKDLLADNPKNVLSQLSSIGFSYIEGFEGSQGLFWGMPSKDFGTFLNNNNLNMPSAHCNWESDLEKKAEQMATIGGKYLICPYVGPQPSLDHFKTLAEKFNKAGEVCRSFGLKFAYHNHDYSFIPVDEVLPQDLLMKHTDPSLVDFEMDLYWLDVANVNILEFLKTHQQRINLLHIKDRKINNDQHSETCTLGEGSISYEKILNEVKNLPIKYFIYEQEHFSNKGVFQDVSIGAKHLQSILI